MGAEPWKTMDWSVKVWFPDKTPFSQPELMVAALTTEPGTKTLVTVPKESGVNSPVFKSCLIPDIDKTAPVFGLRATA
ncbi:Uncharacterised protein [Streptococcus pneumoniae]|nr:Uncharacterised protein [Streptococcus pneumoniae]CIV73424.1 Uncharacterised protein [Streptococcus pneumoniae]CRF29568.1 Uncharacterised protein [Streptococcus pneumoniae]